MRDRVAQSDQQYHGWCRRELGIISIRTSERLRLAFRNASRLKNSSERQVVLSEWQRWDVVMIWQPQSVQIWGLHCCYDLVCCTCQDAAPSSRSNRNHFLCTPIGLIYGISRLCYYCIEKCNTNHQPQSKLSPAYIMIISIINFYNLIKNFCIH